jgi:hypothetical protein
VAAVIDLIPGEALNAQTQVVEMPQRQQGGIVTSNGRMTVADVVQHAMVVQEVMQAVMKPELHYGTIPGTPKPTLYKAGAEKLCMVFKIGDEYRIEDLSTADAVRYRVACIGRHQTSGVELGQGLGECSSTEEKYRWRKAICREEFDATPVNMRRTKYARGKGGSFYTQDQVRTEPADLANTVLKMASKRAKIAMVLNVLAVSDMFGQDLEDLDAVLQEHLAGDEHQQQPEEAQRPAAPAVWPDDKFTEQLARWAKAVAAGLKTVADIEALALSKGTLTEAQSKAIRAIPPKADAPAAVAAAADPFVDEMVAAERAQEGGAA